MDNTISTNLTLDSFLAHEGKGHLDGGHSGRYPWGSGERPHQSLEPVINPIKNDPAPPANTKDSYKKAVKFVSPKLYARTASAEELKAAIAAQEAKAERQQLAKEFVKNQKRLNKGKPLATTSSKRDTAISRMSDEELKARTDRLNLEGNYKKARISAGKVTARQTFFNTFKEKTVKQLGELASNALVNTFIGKVSEKTSLDFQTPGKKFNTTDKSDKDSDKSKSDGTNDKNKTKKSKSKDTKEMTVEEFIQNSSPEELAKSGLINDAVVDAWKKEKKEKKKRTPGKVKSWVNEKKEDRAAAKAD